MTYLFVPKNNNVQNHSSLFAIHSGAFIFIAHVTTSLAVNVMSRDDLVPALWGLPVPRDLHHQLHFLRLEAAGQDRVLFGQGVDGVIRGPLDKFSSHCDEERQ